MLELPGATWLRPNFGNFFNFFQIFDLRRPQVEQTPTCDDELCRSSSQVGFCPAASRKFGKNCKYSNLWELEFSGFRRNRTDDLGINSPSLWPTEARLHVRSCVIKYPKCTPELSPKAHCQQSISFTILTSTAWWTLPPFFAQFLRTWHSRRILSNMHFLMTEKIDRPSDDNYVNCIQQSFFWWWKNRLSWKLTTSSPTSPASSFQATTIGGKSPLWTMGAR